jgi:GSCFA family
VSIYVASAKEARRNFARNPGSRWHKRDALLTQPDGALASQRLRRTFFTPEIAPGFKLHRGDKFFAIGSCFARGIESALVGQKMEVLSVAPEFASFQTINKEVSGLGFINKYNTFSIYNELRWALDPAAEFPRESIVDLGEGLFCDPHTNPTLQLAGLEETLHRRSIIKLVTARIAQCRIVIVTLGLAEAWRDTVTNTFVNTTPIPQVWQSHPDRYEFHVTDFIENFTNLEQIHALLDKFGHPEVQIVVTVSPVPLMATFSTQDVVLANTYSKSLLRTVAHQWATAHQNVHYFPSYEIVLNSEKAVTWEEDLRHVRGAVVTHIMNVFQEHYLEK